MVTLSTGWTSSVATWPSPTPAWTSEFARTFGKPPKLLLLPGRGRGKEEEEEGDSLTKDIVVKNIQEQLLDFEVLLTWFTLLILLILFSLHCLYYSSCFTLLKEKHVCLYTLLGKVRLLLEWVDELLSKMVGEWMDWMDGWIPLRRML